MKKLTIIQTAGFKMFKKHFPGLKSNSWLKSKYLACGCPEPQSSRFLERAGVEPLFFSELSPEQTDEFIKDYVGMVGRLARKHNSRLWWATDFISKNPFKTQFLTDIQQFLEIVRFLQEPKTHQLFVLQPSRAVYRSLKVFCRQNSIEIIIFDRRFSAFFELAAGMLRKTGAALRDAFFVLARSGYARVRLGAYVKERSNSQDKYYLIKTFIYDHSFSSEGAYRDAFFGPLPGFLRRKKKVAVMGVILGKFTRTIEKIRKNPDEFIFPVEYFITSGDILWALGHVFFSQLKFKEHVRMGKYDVTEIVRFELRKSLKGIQLFHLLHYACIRNLLKQIEVETFLYPYENRPWERMCCLSFLDHHPQTRLLGYQHTVVCQTFANFFLSRDEQMWSPGPERVLTAGEIPKKIMERYGDFRPGFLDSSCALRFEYLLNKNPEPRKIDRNVLVVLEGVEQAADLAKYVFRQLRSLPAYCVKFRTHPALPWTYFHKKYGFDLGSVGHFHLSEASSLAQDLSWADVVIYWGTTVALEALWMGKPVIHYSRGDILSFDPLFDCPFLKWKTSEQVPLEKVLEEISRLDHEKATILQQQARQYLSAYLHPITEQNLSKFI